MGNRIISFDQNKAWVNGNEFFGLVEEGSVEAKRKMLDYDGFALPAGVKVPGGKLEPITAKLKVKVNDPLVLRELNKNRGFIQLKLKGRATVYASTQGVVEDQDVSTRINGFLEEVPTPDYKNGNEISSMELTIHVHFLEVAVNGAVVLKVDTTSGEVVPRDLI
jgi:phage tail tube protein FII